ncbi:MAG TPA: prolipoprotein diacylglyceryl transferase family protein [Myxococcota bacterium]|nr:prolipoprotein diacylglyceryl transferase family protein [Myxococcota bacterium]
MVTPLAPRPGLLDRFARPTVQLFGAARSTYQVVGITGFALAVGLGVVLARARGLPAGVVGLLAAAAVVTFLAQAWATKLVTGVERLVYYRHEVAVAAVASGLARLLGAPVLPYLELTVLALGLFLAFGRLGCFAVGCCYGRTHRHGVRYGDEHAAAGFPAELVGVPVFPVQLVEAGWVLAVAALGSALVLRGAPAGEALAAAVLGYGAGRFLLELARGDEGRPYLLGASEAQWTSVLLAGLVLQAELRGAWTFRPWHAAVALALLGALLATLARTWRARRRQPSAALATAPSPRGYSFSRIRVRAEASAPDRGPTLAP